MLDRRELEQMLDTMVRSGAATLHLMANRAPFFRLQGRLVRSRAPAPAAGELEQVADELLSPDQRSTLDDGGEVATLVTSAAGGRFRTSMSRDREGLTLVFRRAPETVPSFDELGLPDLLSTLAELDRGLVLVTGFLGSGKTTTLAAIVDHVNRGFARHVVTLERRVEFVHRSASSLIHQREIGRHVPDARTGIVDAVHQSADVIVVDDVGDHAALDAALDAAQSGCSVFAGMQASSVVDALERIADGCPYRQRERTMGRVAAALRAVLSQALLQRGHAGGHVPLVEVLIKTRAVAAAIRDGELAELPRLMERNHGLGMQTGDRALKDLLARNQITIDEALYHASDRHWIARRIQAS